MRHDWKETKIVGVLGYLCFRCVSCGQTTRIPDVASKKAIRNWLDGKKPDCRGWRDDERKPAGDG